MNKRILAIIVALAVIVIAAVAVLAAQNSNDSADPSVSTSESETSDGTTDTIDNDGSGDYVEYSPTAIADADGRIFLFFHATWCPQCVSLDGDIIAEGVPAGLTIIKVDYDSNQDLRAEYGVTQQTTIVEVDSSGDKLQDNFVPYADPKLQTVLAAMI